MKGGVYAALAVGAPLDPSFSLVTSPFLSPLALAILRLSLAFYGTVFVVIKLVYEGINLHTDDSFFSYFTDLSYIGLLSYFWASGVQTLHFALTLRKQRSLASPSPRYALQAWPRLLQFLHLLLLSTVTTFPILVTAVFWSLLSDPDTLATRYNAWSNISEHALNTAFAGLEILLSNVGPSLPRRPYSGIAMPWVHLPFLILLLAGYLGVAYITSETQHFYTYSFLDPHKEGAKLAAYIVGIAVAEIVIFVVVRYIMMLRAFLVARYLAPQSSGYSDRDRDFAADADADEKGARTKKKEAFEDWEEVGRPSIGSGERGIAL